MNTLLALYPDTDRDDLPAVVTLALSSKLGAEREYLESLIARVEPRVQKDWIGHLVTSDHDQHLGTWFAMMLFGWLSEFAPTRPEPSVCGDKPDFLVDVDGRQVVVEARAVIKKTHERLRDNQLGQVLGILAKVERPFVVRVTKYVRRASLSEADLISAVTTWLDDSSETRMEYRDALGNELDAVASPAASVSRVQGMCSDAYRGTSKRLRGPVKEKAGQHPCIRAAGYPYILAFYLESTLLWEDDIIDVWFGTEGRVPAVAAVSEEWGDQHRSSLAFHGAEIKHRDVSGTLVFKAELDRIAKRRHLVGFYAENPYAHSRVAPDSFPTVARYVVRDRSPEWLSMAWERPA